MTREAFEARTDKSGVCWLWRGGYRGPGGYRQFKEAGKTTYGHRKAWQLAYGPIPPGLSVLHGCDVPACVAPHHLFLGTLADNCRDRHAKGRTAHQLSVPQRDNLVKELERVWQETLVEHTALTLSEG